MDDGQSMLMEVTGCDLQTAARTLQQTHGDISGAVEILLSRGNSQNNDPHSGWSSDAELNHVSTQHQQQTEQTSVIGIDRPPGGPARPSTPGQHSKATTQATDVDQRNAWNNPSGEGVRRSERITGKRSSPIDLTAEDDDEDLRKAMQASLESESNRQKRHQEYGLGQSTGGGNAAGLSEQDEALTRAIEASMLQSHSATRAQSPELTSSQLDAMGASQLRSPDRPVAILAPSPFMKIFALALQALFTSESFRRALLSVRFTDLRTRRADEHAMEGYWRGVSPSGVSRPALEQWIEANVDEDVREAIDGFMRLATLFVFLTYTKRPLVVADDVITHPTKGNYAYVMNSERKPSQDIMSCYIQGLLDMLIGVSGYLEGSSSPGVCDAGPFKQSFQSFTANAVAPLRDEEPKKVRKPGGEAYEVVVHNLVQSKINNTVHRALYGCLADEKALYTSLGETLLFCLGRPGQHTPVFGPGWDPVVPPDKEELGQFHIEMRIYLDAFMFARRNGVRFGLDTDEVKGRQARVEDLEKYKKAISTHHGDDTRATLRASIAYFRDLCQDDGSDHLRTSSINEAGPRLEAILAHLEQEIEDVDKELQEQRDAIDRARNFALAEFESLLARKDYQKMPYDLQAVLMEDANTSWAYVQHHDELQRYREEYGRWWCVKDGEVIRVKEEDILADQGTPFFLVYTAAEAADEARNANPEGESAEPDAIQAASLANLKVNSTQGDGHPSKESHMELEDHRLDGSSKPAKSLRLDTSREWWGKQPLLEAVEHDNAVFGTQLATALARQEDIPQDQSMPSSQHATFQVQK